MWAYKFMIGWKNHDHIDFDFYNAHDLNVLRLASSEETIKAKLRERMKNAKLLVVLIGDSTKNLFRFVRWEMEIARTLGIPIVAVYLNKSKKMDPDVCPDILKNELVLHIPYKQAAIKWAIDNWIDYHASHKKEGHKAVVFTDSHYKQLDI